MESLTKTSFSCLALALTNGHPVLLEGEGGDDVAVPDRCEGIEFDAITPDEKGTTYFFKGGHVWSGFSGPAQRSNQFFKDLDEIHNIGHVDAAFRMHNTENLDDHDHIYFFLDDRVFSYYNHTREDGYPKKISEDFTGIPSNSDAAVECPKGECGADSVLFFKGQDVHVYDILTKTVKTKTWSHSPACTSAVRWSEHYYCFHGNNFTRFNPVTGEVNGNYPKDARHYFMKCPNFGHGGHGHGGNYTVPKCSDVKLDAITTDDSGKSYFFAGHIYMRSDSHRDGLHAFPINRTWKEMTGPVDAVFSYTDKIYMIKDDQVYIYKEGAPYTSIEGYPKTSREELGMEIGKVDAAFVCPKEHTVQIVQASNIAVVDLTATPRTITQNSPFAISGGIDAALCGADGIKLFQGSQYFEYESTMEMSLSRIVPVPIAITSNMMGCQD